MKITNYVKDKFRTTALGNVPTAGVVIMTKAFHQDHKADDLFMVMEVPNCYLPKEKYRSERGEVTALSNLRTGTLSYVKSDRACIEQEAEVHHFGDLK